MEIRVNPLAMMGFAVGVSGVVTLAVAAFFGLGSTSIVWPVVAVIGAMDLIAGIAIFVKSQRQ